jgi:hypothetical protein
LHRSFANLFLSSWFDIVCRLIMDMIRTKHFYTKKVIILFSFAWLYLESWKAITLDLLHNCTAVFSAKYLAKQTSEWIYDLARLNLRTTAWLIVIIIKKKFCCIMIYADDVNCQLTALLINFKGFVQGPAKCLMLFLFLRLM